MMELLCETCEKVFYSDEMPHRGPVCFKCHIKGVRLGFTYGQEDFHGPTIRERQRQTVEQAAINGYTAEPVTNWM
jgi:cytochrome c5